MNRKAFEPDVLCTECLRPESQGEGRGTSSGAIAAALPCLNCPLPTPPIALPELVPTPPHHPDWADGGGESEEDEVGAASDHASNKNHV